MKQVQLKLIDYAAFIILALAVSVLSFPNYSLSYSTSIDPSLIWVFNFLFSGDIELARNIIFPHGPLAFLMYPLADNVLPAVLLNILLKSYLTIGFITLAPGSKALRFTLGTFSALILSLMLNLNTLLIAGVLVSFFLAQTRKAILFQLIGLLLTALAFYVRAYGAVITLALSIVHIAYLFAIERNYKTALVNLLFLFSAIVVIWLLLYGGFQGFGRYLIGQFNLAQDNSSAAAFYPYNNWWLLAGFIAAFLAFLSIIEFSKKAYVSLMLAVMIFAGWKHGTAREDVVHFFGLIDLTLLALLSGILVLKQKYIIQLSLSIVMIGALWLNIYNIDETPKLQYESGGITNFKRIVFNYNEAKKTAEEGIQANTAVKVLPEKLRNEIGDDYCDVYPWDYSLIAANNLNWRPRPVIQSYASYTPWLDSLNAEWFSSVLAPEYLIWEMKRGAGTFNIGYSESIDHRYLLNDEPQTLLSLFSNYRLHHKDEKVLVLKRSENALIVNRTYGELNHIEWDQWLPIDSTENALSRLKVNFEKGFLQRLKSFVYKDEQFWIYYKLKSGSIRKYRIIPKNAADGIWLNPFFEDLQSNAVGTSVEAVLFTCSNHWLVPSNIGVQIETIEFNAIDAPEYVEEFFGKNRRATDSMIHVAKLGYEKPTAAGWSGFNKDRLDDEMQHTGDHAERIEPGATSAIYRLPVAGFKAGAYRLEASCWVYSPEHDADSQSSLVVSIQGDGVKNKWHALPIKNQLIHKHTWNHISNYIDFKYETGDGTLSVFFSNKSNDTVYVDDFQIFIVKQELSVD